MITREEMLDIMIQMYGFENPITIQFAEMCESYVNYPTWDKCLEEFLKFHERLQFENED